MSEPINPYLGVDVISEAYNKGLIDGANIATAENIAILTRLSEHLDGKKKRQAAAAAALRIGIMQLKGIASEMRDIK